MISLVLGVIAAGIGVGYYYVFIYQSVHFQTPQDLNPQYDYIIGVFGSVLIELRFPYHCVCINVFM